MKHILLRIFDFVAPLFSSRAAGIYMLLFAAAIGIGTFIENDFGTSSAQHVIYKAGWFTLLLALFSMSIIVNIFRFRMVQQKKWALLTFHAAMIVILLGAAVTRYYGYEGMMHIREDGTANSMLSSDTYVQMQLLHEGQRYQIDRPVLFSTLGNNNLKERYLLGEELIELELLEFIPNPVQKLVESPDGKPTVKVVFGSTSGREEYFVSLGQTESIRGVLFNFNENPIKGAVNIALQNEEVVLQSDQILIRTQMATQQTDTLPAGPEYRPLLLRSMYRMGQAGFVFGDYNPSATVKIESEDAKVRNESITALRMAIRVNGEEDELLVYGQKGAPGRPAVTRLSGLSLAVSYGSKEIVLPFSIKLYDFILERYPGTNSPASFASEVQLIDERTGLKEDHRIYMNHVLDHDGFRFFQSSYDQDELGTVLSVNHDFWGTWISYIGYALLTLGMIFSLFSKKSRFRQVSKSIKKLREQRSALLVIALLSIAGMASAQNPNDPPHLLHPVEATHAKAFSQVVVQDHKGRMKPMHTLTRELMRKVHRSESLDGLNADQVILGMFVRSQDWLDVPFIKLGKHEKWKQLLGVESNRAAFSDFFSEDRKYLLREEVRRANSLQPIDRGVFEKELIKIDERVNIMNMIFTGSLLRLIPVEGDERNTWVSTHAGQHNHDHDEQSVAARFFPAYQRALLDAIEDGDYTLPNKLLAELRGYQDANGANVMPSQSKLDAEVFLNELNVFNRLAAVYAILGVCFLFFLFFSVFRPDVSLKWVFRIMLSVVLVSFAFHTLGLSLRWFVSGRAPWSNGYESMIYIAWTTMLAGILFSRKSLGGLAATTVQSATVLLVAMLSYLDPEITPLVPVLRSYWLSIHVSLEAGSYGFLMLGAVIGLINLLLMIFLNKQNEKRVFGMVKEMTYLSEMTLIGGLFMISIGTYLGGVWANESWGRYWGWDAKETWALVTILVYAFILHMRIIPKMNGLYAFNFSSIFGLASVIMTYYGVNYYLSGLHSYAAGDPVPIPSWVYIAVAVIVLIAALAFWRKRQFKLIS